MDSNRDPAFVDKTSEVSGSHSGTASEMDTRTTSGTAESKARLRSCIDELLDVPDSKWLRLAEGGTRADSDSDRIRVGAIAIRMASDHWAKLQANRGSADRESQGQQELRPVQAIEQLGITVLEETPGPLDSHYIHFAAFDPSENIITVSVAGVQRVTEAIERAQLDQLLGTFSVMDLVLWHEYFHVWSHAERKSIERESRGRGRLFRLRKAETPDVRTPRRTHERTLEELAAVEFSRQACGLGFQPQLLQWLLIYTYDLRRAFELAENILEKS